MLRLPSATKGSCSPQLRHLKDYLRCLASDATGGQALPSHARVVVVGGGMVGTSVAYHLAKFGWGSPGDVVLLEQNQLTSGTTWHAAGLMVTWGNKSSTVTELRKYTRNLYSSLEAEVGLSTGFKPIGFLGLATSPDRLHEFRRVAVANRACGVDVQEVGPNDVKNLFPLCKTDDVLAGFYVAEDGRVNPVDACMAIAKGARMYGAQIFEGVTVAGITKEGGRVTGVVTQHGTIKADIVVNCAGMWARQFGEICGVNIPNQAAEHYYMLTDTMPDVDPTWPVIDDPSSSVYIRPEAGGLLVGILEPVAAAWNLNGIPGGFSFGEIEPDWERMNPYLEVALSRVPRAMEVGMKKLFCGPESFTADGEPIVGEAPELRNYFVAAGMNTLGILSGPGYGRLLANWIMTGKPDMDVTRMNIARLQPFQNTPAYRKDRISETLGMLFRCDYPSLTLKSARGAKTSPLHERLSEKGAFFNRDVSGWEVADWFAPPGVRPEMGNMTWGRHDWFPYWASEHRACRIGVILADVSFTSKLLIQGPDAGRVLNWLSTANVNGKEGRITYTQWLDSDGKVQADLTVSKIETDKFLLVAGDSQLRQMQAWMSRHIKDMNGNATVLDVSGAYAHLSLQGPKSRGLLQKLTSVAMNDECFPLASSREIDIGYAMVRCNRISTVGELGYELMIPTEHANHVYDLIVAMGHKEDLVHCGMQALASLGLEKGFPEYGRDMNNVDTLVQCGLDFTADFHKTDSFLGANSVLAEKSRGKFSKRLLKVMCLDTECMLYHAEVVLRDGVPLGKVRGASYGHTLNGSVGLFMAETPDGSHIDDPYVSSGFWEVDVAGQRYPVRVSFQPMYDPSEDNMKP